MASSWCVRCRRSQSPGQRLPGDTFCQRCRTLQSEVSRQAVDPCDELLLLALGDPAGADTLPRRKPAGPKKLAAIRAAMAGKAGGALTDLVGKLLPGERAIVESALPK